MKGSSRLTVSSCSCPTSLSLLTSISFKRIGCIPIMALPSHRFHEITQFVQLSGAVACATPDKTKDFDYRDLVRRAISKEILGIIFGDAPAGFLSLNQLIERRANRSRDDLKVMIDPEDPAVFQLSAARRAFPSSFPERITTTSIIPKWRRR